LDADETFFERTLAPVVTEALRDTPVVILLGSRQCGKTTLARRLAPERPLISLDNGQLRQAAVEDPDSFVDGLPPIVTIDEVQRAPELLSAIKRSVDEDRRAGRFLLTGSANLLLLPKVSESLAGRMEIAHLQPLTESEKIGRPGRFLAELLSGRIGPDIRGDKAATGWAERMIQGGYPEPLTRTAPRARQWYRQYVRGLLEQDVEDIARIRDSAALARLLELVALRTGELLNTNGLATALGLHRTTVEQYLSVLERLFLVRRLPAWHRNAAKRLIKAPKLHFCDSGLASALADIAIEELSERRERFGHLLESFVVQQLVAQAAWTDPDLRFWHYRDKDKVEVDLVITRGRKTWGIEVKSASRVGAKDGAGLERLASQCGNDFQQGIVLYAGSDRLPIAGGHLLAVPIADLWTH